MLAHLHPILFDDTCNACYPLPDMVKVHEEWCVLPHGPIEELAENLWRVEGTLKGMDLKRVLIIARRTNGELVIHNAVALDDDAMARIEAWGQPTTLIVPNGYHRLDAPAFQKRYPDAIVLCPEGARKKVAMVVRVDGTYEDFPADDTISFEPLAGVGGVEGVMVVRSEDGVTLVFNDALFNMPHGSGVAGFVFRHITQSTGGPRVSRLFRWLAMKDRKAFRADLERFATWPDLRRIVVSHHETITDDPAGVLREVAASL